MPYIEQKRRDQLNTTHFPETPGELNYRITRLCTVYLEKYGLSYTRINEVIGVLECAKQEFYRRVAVPYEDKKRRQNGDVYE